MTQNIHISLNGEPYQLPINSSLGDLVKAMGIAEQRYAIEVNRTIIPRSQHTDYQPDEGDVIEVVQAIGGG